MLRCVLPLVLSVGCTGSTSHARPASQASAPNRLAEFSSDLQALAARVEPSVVQIFASGYAPVVSSTGPTLALRNGTGSGLFIGSDGLILTNAHVVQGAQRLLVSLPRAMSGESILKPRGSLHEARVIGIDPETDLALIDIEDNGYSPLSFGDSESLSVGEMVLAFGSPRGLDGSVTMGVVSTVARQLEPDAPMVYIQTDAPINPGNSGGPLVNMKGEVVGINTLIFSESGGSEGIGFAVPSHIARTVVEQLRSYGRVRRGTIGVQTQTVEPVLADGLGLPRSWGVILADVYPNSPAAQAGLLPGDMVLNLNGKRMENARQFDVNVYHQELGRSVSLDILRSGERLRKAVRVVERPDALGATGLQVDPEEDHIQRLGILAIDVGQLPPPLLARLRRKTGVAVVANAPGQEAQGGLRSGDVIHGVNGGAVVDRSQLQDRLSQLGSRTPAVLQIERRGRLAYLSFMLE